MLLVHFIVYCSAMKHLGAIPKLILGQFSLAFFCFKHKKLDNFAGTDRCFPTFFTETIHTLQILSVCQFLHPAILFSRAHIFVGPILSQIPPCLCPETRRWYFSWFNFASKQADNVVTVVLKFA